MHGEAAAEKKLHDAASKGNVAALKQLLQRDPHLLDRVSFACSNRTPLHTATLQGNEDIVIELLRRNPQLAEELDSQRSSPLHIAAARGYVDIASLLSSAAPSMCWSRDSHGMNPVHVAAMRGHVATLKMLLDQDLFPAKERLHRGETILHLCIKHRQVTAFKVLVEALQELLSVKDDDGETVLHLAVRCDQLEIVHYLVVGGKIKKDEPNSAGKTALDILYGTPLVTNNYYDMKEILMILSKRSILEALPLLSNTTMVVVVLIATMAFQATVSPPGGVWQEDSSSHRAGDAVMATTHPNIFKHFVRANTTAFISSLITIFLITTRQPSGRIFFLLIAMYATWVSLAAITVSYGASLIVITPNTERQSLVPVIITVVVVSSSIMAFILVSSRIRQLYLSWKRKKERDEDFTNDPPIQRASNFIFQRLEPVMDYRLGRMLELVIRGSITSRPPRA